MEDNAVYLQLCMQLTEIYTSTMYRNGENIIFNWSYKGGRQGNFSEEADLGLLTFCPTPQKTMLSFT